MPAGRSDVGVVELQVRDVGTLSLPQGQLGVSDAFVNDAPVVVSNLPSGEHPVELLIASATSDARVAAARVRFGQAAVASWRLAGAIAVDSGTGAFFDPRLPAGIGVAGIERFNARLLDALESSYRPTYSTAAFAWDELAVFAFSTGFGDGAYPVFVGASAAGAPVIVLVDCEILPWER